MPSADYVTLIDQKNVYLKLDSKPLVSLRIMMKFIFFLFVLSPFLMSAQKDSLSSDLDAAASEMLENAEKNIAIGIKNFSDLPRNNQGVRVMFYNTENLFYPEDDSTKRDDDFTVEGMKRWSYYRYQQKLNNIYKVIMAVGGWEPPSIIGFCELEHKKVLEDLINKTPLLKWGYEIVHEESPDRRGIDVGLIYRPDKFKYVAHEAIQVDFPFDASAKTRDVLHVQGQILGKDTLSVFVNHWPSRYGGQAVSEPRRIYVASLLRSKIDSMQLKDANSKVIVMGDMNDYADNESLLLTLKAKSDLNNLESGDLYNYMHALSKNWQMGSHKYQGHWGTLDHMIVSASLLKENRKNHIKASSTGGQIFSARFLMEEDSRYLGLQPFRTYAGPRYIGGFSDHLPIYLDIMIN